MTKTDSARSGGISMRPFGRHYSLKVRITQQVQSSTYYWLFTVLPNSIDICFRKFNTRFIWFQGFFACREKLACKFPFCIIIGSTKLPQICMSSIIDTWVKVSCRKWLKYKKVWFSEYEIHLFKKYFTVSTDLQNIFICKRLQKLCLSKKY